MTQEDKLRKQQVETAKKRIVQQSKFLIDYVENSKDNMPMYAINITNMIGVMRRNVSVLFHPDTPEEKLVKALFGEPENQKPIKIGENNE